MVTASSSSASKALLDTSFASVSRNKLKTVTWGATRDWSRSEDSVFIGTIASPIGDCYLFGNSVVQLSIVTPCCVVSEAHSNVGAS